MFEEKTLKMMVQIKKWYHLWDAIQKGQFSETKNPAPYGRLQELMQGCCLFSSVRI